MSTSLPGSNADPSQFFLNAKYDTETNTIHIKAEKKNGFISWIKANLLPASWFGHYKLDKINELIQTHSQAQIIADDTPPLIEVLLFLKNKHVTETNPSKSTPKQILINSAVQSIFSDQRISHVTGFHALVSDLVKKADGNSSHFAIDYSSYKELFKKNLKELIQSSSTFAIDDTLNAIANINKLCLSDLCSAVYADLEELQKKTFSPYMQWANSLPQIPPEYQLQSLEVLKICQLADKRFTETSSSTTPDSFLYVKKEENIARSVILDPKTRDIFILNKEKSGRPKMTGTYKKVTEAIQVPLYNFNHTKPVEVVMQLVNKDNTTLDRHELEYFKLFRGHPNLMHSSNYVTYTKKKNGIETAKTSLIQKKCNSLKSLVEDANKGKNNIITQTRLDISKQISFIRGMAHALTTLHGMTKDYENNPLQNGLVHCDIKVGNILLQTDAQGNPIPILTDFGMIKSPQTRHQTVSSMAGYGTRFATAPEVLRSQMHSNRQAEDMYALGHALYETLYSEKGDLPWGDDMHKIFKKRKNNEDTSALETQVLNKQGQISQIITNLTALSKPLSPENEIALLTYRLLDPDPQTRLTAVQLQKEIQRIEQAFSQKIS